MLTSRLPVAAAGSTLDHELQVAIQLARDAGAVLRSRQMAQIEIWRKGRGEIVTPADLASNEIICRGLSKEFPGDTVCSEEGPPVASGSVRTWFVDPLDSTSNYVQCGNEYSVSIGLAINGEAVLGVVYNPARDELFTGCIGKGVFCNGIRAEGVDRQALRQLTILVSSKEWKHSLNRLGGSMSVRPMASMAYKMARVASGKEDAVFSLKTRKPWGTCAGTALVLAAGGLVTTIQSEPLVFDCRGPRTFDGLVAARRSLHPGILVLALGLRPHLGQERGA